MIVIVFGLPGSGKSYFASRLAKLINADYILSDKVRKNMLIKRTYSEKEKLSVYNEMRAQMKQAIKKNKNVVLDATFYKSDIRKKFINDASREEAIIFIEVKADERLIRERLKQLRERDSEADFKVYEIIKAQWEPLHEKHLILQSTDDNIDDMLHEAIDYLYMKNDQRTNK